MRARHAVPLQEGKVFRKGTRFCAPTGEMRLGKVQGFVGNAGDNANGG